MAVLFRTRILTSVGAALGSAKCRDKRVGYAGRAGPWTCSLLLIPLPQSGYLMRAEARSPPSDCTWKKRGRLRTKEWHARWERAAYMFRR